MEFAKPTHFRAEKVGGEYQASGTVVSIFQTTAGATRYVFEFDTPKGMLHLYTAKQLAIAETGSMITDLDAISRQVLFEAYAATFGPLDPNLTANDIEFHICEIIKDAGPARVNEPCPDPLVPYLRQYVHNDLSPGFVFGYEKVGTDREFARLNARVKELEAAGLPEHWRAKAEHIVSGKMDATESATQAIMLLRVLLAAPVQQAAPVEALTDEEIEAIGANLDFQSVADKRYRENSAHGMTVSEQVEYERLHRFARDIEARIKGQQAGGAK